MKLLRVDIEHFACIRKASVEFGPGLNVLYGPNDLGKSTLARAVRAALLVQHTSSVGNQFIEWDSDENPSVKVTLELPDRRIWRVEKRFGSSGNSAVLRESTDGATFSPYKKAREVDDEVRTRLGWGIASPATKGAPKGLPSSFLATVLLGEQTDVAGVLRQTLEADSDESGRARLTSALAAFAQDPLFKAILEEAQGNVDIAFTAKGAKKRGKTSPFREVTDEVKRVKEELEQLAKRVDDSENARRELEACNAELLQRREAVETAVEARDALRVAEAQLDARRKVEEELAGARTTLEEQQGEVRSLEERQEQLAETSERVVEAEKEHAAAAEQKERLVAQEKAAEDAVRRAKSDEAERARQLRRGELEKSGLELDSQAKALSDERAAAAKGRSLHADLVKATQRAVELSGLVQESRSAVDAAEAEAEEAGRQLELVDVAARLSQKRKLEASIEQLDQVRCEVEADRSRAEEHRARSKELLDGIPPNLPVAAGLASLRELAHELEVAEARLGGGLAVVVERLAAVDIRGSADGSDIRAPAEGTVSFEATRGFVLQIGDVAKVSVTAGEREAREHEAALRKRWDAEVAPVLAQSGAADLATLAARVEQAESVRKQAAEAAATATSLEERAATREEQLGKLESLREEIRATDRELEGNPVDEAAKLLDGLEGRSLDAHRADLKQRHSAAQDARDAAQAALRGAETESEVLAERTSTTEKAIAELGVSEPESGWDAVDVELSERSAKLKSAQEQITTELASLAVEQDAELATAESALAKVREELTTVESALTAARELVDTLRGQASRLEGEIETRRAAVAKLDVEASTKRVDEIAQRLQDLPTPARAVTADQLRDAERHVEEAKAAHDRARDAVRKAEGALQTVGGQVVIEQQDAAKDALRQAEQKEREVELDYDAWRLLVDKLREAENTEGQHLGEALSQPVTERFAELTAHRYGKLEVAPNLQAEGLRVAGILRDVGALSVGTQEQLATLLRLTIAEQLGNMLLLDDHLTQTDPERGAWFRDLLRQHASKTQVIVLTCRPEHYLVAGDLPEDGEASVSRAGGLVRAIDLSLLLERGGSSREAATS